MNIVYLFGSDYLNRQSATFFISSNYQPITERKGIKMIERKNEASRNLEKALQALEQAKQRVANEKKKQNEKKRKVENHHKYIMGGIIVKYFPDCYQYDERFLETLSEALTSSTEERRQRILDLCL